MRCAVTPEEPAFASGTLALQSELRSDLHSPLTNLPNTSTKLRETVKNGVIHLYQSHGCFCLRR